MSEYGVTADLEHSVKGHLLSTTTLWGGYTFCPSLVRALTATNGLCFKAHNRVVIVSAFQHLKSHRFFLNVPSSYSNTLSVVSMFQVNNQ